jgi:hypothetical protein
VIAVGLADGRVLLHNIKYDETVMTFTQDWGPVTAISFRTGQFDYDETHHYSTIYRKNYVSVNLHTPYLAL